jgi:pimeloyl-ACP methyl ester carboxylesterase
MTDTDTGTLDVEGGRLYWQTTGRGTPMILLHGFSFDHRSWDPQRQAFAAQHRVVRYDLRGFGASTVPQGPYRHMDDLRALTHAFNLEKPVLVGLSLGANVALAYSIAHPKDVGGLVLASPGLPGHRWLNPRPPEAAAAFAAEHGVAAGRRFWLDHAIFRSLRAHPDAYRTVAGMVGDYSGWHWQNTDPQQPGPDIRAGLGTLGVATLVISGDLDVEGYREIAGEISRSVPRASLQRFANGGHVMNLEQPAEFTMQVLRFVASLGVPHV